MSNVKWLSDEEKRGLNMQRARMIRDLLNQIMVYDGTVAIIEGAIEVQPLAQGCEYERTIPILIGFDKGTGKYEIT